MKPRLLDLFCGAGGAAQGYANAGFEVVGVDIEPQPNFPFEFRHLDALEMLRGRLRVGNLEWDRFDAIHASPPCQAYSSLARMWNARMDHPDLILETRELLKATGFPYVIENVVGAPLINPVQLCGSAVGLPLIRRHRLFEVNFPLMVSPCHHGIGEKKFPALDAEGRRKGQRSSIVGVYGHGGDKRADLWPEAMGIDWMTRAELTQAIPPAMTEHIGHYLLLELEAKVAA